MNTIGKAAFLAVLAFSLGSPIAMAVVYTDPPDEAYESLSQAAFCMNHFYYRTSGHIGHEAGWAAQTALAAQLKVLKDETKIAEALRLAFSSASKPPKDDSVPIHCRQFIPTDHSMNDAQVQYFMSHSADLP